MSINKERYKNYNALVEDLQKELEFDELAQIIEAKIFEYLVKSSPDLNDLTERDLCKQIQPLFNPEYYKYIAKMDTNIVEVINAVNHYYDDLGPEVNLETDRIKATEKALKSRIGKYSERAVEYYAKTIRTAVDRERTLSEIRRQLKEAGGKVAFYADTLARTGIKGMSRTGKADKSRLGEIYWMEYVGIIRAETRSFCLAMIGQTRHLNVIRQMRNGQIEPVINYCGGFNCHHDWEPDPFYTPPENDKVRWQEVPLGKGRIIKYTLNI
jgi:hypothetical protein